MARRNIHQRKAGKKNKPAASRPAVQPAAAATPRAATTIPPPPPPRPAYAAPVRSYTPRAAAAQLPDEVRFAELPWELKRIALFTAFVVVLLIVLWFFLK